MASAAGRAVENVKLTLANFPRTLSAMPDGIKLSEFVARCKKNITGCEYGQAQK
jgi:hypothetical protein